MELQPRCPCGGVYQPRWVEVRMTVGDAGVLRDVPQGACPDCGSRVYTTAVLRRVEGMMRGETERVRAHTCPGG